MGLLFLKSTLTVPVILYKNYNSFSASRTGIITKTKLSFLVIKQIFCSLTFAKRASLKWTGSRRQWFVYNMKRVSHSHGITNGQKRALYGVSASHSLQRLRTATRIEQHFAAFAQLVSCAYTTTTARFPHQSGDS